MGKMLAFARVGRPRCTACGRHIPRSSDGPYSPSQLGAKVFETFLPADDGREFEEVIRDLANAEGEFAPPEGLSPADRPPARGGGVRTPPMTRR
jgi:hypothetical protein